MNRSAGAEWPETKNKMRADQHLTRRKAEVKQLDRVPTGAACRFGDGVVLENDDSMNLYDSWESPVVIIADGPYGIASFPGDPPVPDDLGAWYEPHIRKWTEAASPLTTLWFWNAELGWANVHPVLKRYGWEYKCCNVWNKGIGHIAGNSNTQKLREFPVVTEVCVQYVRRSARNAAGDYVDIKHWLRSEWERTGIPLMRTNEICGVVNAATRKYLTKCHLWYFPPPEMFERLATYANEHGRPEGRPYFSLDGQRAVTAAEWEKMRAKFHCEAGVTNVWDEPPLRGDERIKNGSKVLHINQKPLKLIERLVRVSSDEGDMIWEPFGGLSTVAVAALRLNRKCHSAEINNHYWEIACRRLATEVHRISPSALDLNRDGNITNYLSE